MFSKIPLDVKNANTNQSHTGLAKRFISNRDAYKSGTLCFESINDIQYLLISINNSNIGWSTNPSKEYNVELTGNIVDDLYEYKIDTLDALKDSSSGYLFIKPYFIYAPINTLSSTYMILEEPLFYWTRNDEDRTRFKWEGQTWKLLKGESPTSLGILLKDTTYKIPNKDLLSSDYNDVFVNLVFIEDSFISTRKFKSEADAGSFSFTTEDAVIYVKEKKLVFNPTYANNNEGKEIFFYKEVLGSDTGIVSNNYLSPIPMGFESPLLRLNNKAYLNVLFYDTDNDLPNTLNDNYAYISKSTGKVLYNNPNSETLYYDGLVLSSSPISIVNPINITDNHKIPVKDNFTAGYDIVSDNTGIDFTSGDPTGIRPNNTGKIITILNSNNYVANQDGNIISVNIYNTTTDIPSDKKWSIAYLPLIANVDQTLSIYFKNTYLNAQTELYFIQSSVCFKSYTKYNDNKCFVYSNKRDKFYIPETGYLRFKIDGGTTRNLHITSTGYFTAKEIIDMVGSTYIKQENRHLVIKGNTSVQILDTSDDHILKAFGFVAQTVTDFYLSTGLYFDLSKKTDKSANYDFTSLIEYNDIAVVDNISPSIFTFLDFIPREDYDGYDSNVFFKIDDNTLTEDEILHLFNENKIAWIKNTTTINKIDIPTSVLPLEPGVIPGYTSLSLTKDKESFTLIENENFDVNSSGYARIFNTYSKLASKGYQATINDNTLTTQDTNIVQVNDWIKTDTDYFKVLNKNSQTLTLSSNPTNTNWEHYLGYSEPSNIDKSLLCNECFISLDNSKSFIKIKKIIPTNNNTLKDIISTKCSSLLNLYVRFTDNTESLITILNESSLGLTNSAITLDISDSRFQNLDFKIRVKENIYTPYFDDPTKDVSINSSTGLITLSNTIKNLIAEVVYIPLAINDTEVLINDDVTSEYYGLKTPEYVIEEIPNTEYVLETTGGNISFLNALPPNIGIEVHYYTDESTQVIETILFTISNETTTKVSNTLYTFNSSNYDIETSVTPIVKVGAEILGIFGGTTATISGNNIVLPDNSNPDDYDVIISYSIKQTKGGEYTIKVVNPIWLPLIQIKSNQNTLSLYNDFTNIIHENSIIKIGDQFLIVDSVSFDSLKTNITFTSPARFDSGARSPSDSSNAFVLSNENIFLTLNQNVIARPGATNILISEDLTSYIKENTLLFINDICYQAKTVSLSKDKTKTQVTLKTALSINATDLSTITFSIRPIFEQNTTEIPSPSFLSDKEYKLIKFSNGVGKELVLNFDYSIDEGKIKLAQSHSIQPDIAYYFYHTQAVNLGPILSNGRTIYPTYSANYKQYIETPYPEKILYSKCVINAQDQFYLRIVEQDQYSSEIDFTENAIQGTNGRSKKPISVEKGIGPNIYDNLAKQVIIKNNISTYNKIIRALENLNLNNNVGDQDGQFNYQIIQATEDNFSPGIEDPLTREILPRYVVIEILNSENNGNFYFLPSDTIVSSPTYNSNTGEISGTPYSSSELQALINKQRPLIINDIEDYVFTEVKSKTEFYFLGLRTKLYFVYNKISLSSWSRLYPRKTKSAYYIMNGPFSFLTTRGNVIGTVSNPLFNPITNITSITMQKRGGYYWVFDYSPTGYPTITGSSNPTLVLSAVPIGELYIDPTTNLPDHTKLISSTNPNGSIYSIESGNPDLIIPPLTKGNNLSHYYLNSWQAIYNASESVISGTNFSYRQAQIEDIKFGCYVILNTTSPIYSDASSFSASYGDTIFQNVFGGDIDSTDINFPDYRIGFDVKVSATSGNIIDNSYPSIDDPNFPIQEITNQNPLKGGECLEGDIEFSGYTDTEPFTNLPALLGQSKNDSGLYSTPYFKSSNKEIQILDKLTRDIKDLLYKEYNSELVYPDEIRLEYDNLSPTDDIDISCNDSYDLTIIENKGFFQNTSNSKLRLSKINANSETTNYSIKNFLVGNATVSSPTQISPGVYSYTITFTDGTYDFSSILNIITQRNIIFKFILPNNQSYCTTYINIYRNGASWYVKLSNASIAVPLLSLSTAILNELTFTTSGNIFSLISEDIVFSPNPMYMVTSLNENITTNLSYSPDRSSWYDVFDLSFFAPYNTIYNTINVQTELFINECEVEYYNLDTSSTSFLSSDINNIQTTNNSEPFTFSEVLPNNHTAIFTPFLGHGNLIINPNLKLSIFQSALVTTNSTLPYNIPAYFGHSSNSKYDLILWNISDDISNVLPNDIVSFNNANLIGIVSDVAYEPFYSNIQLKPSFPKFNSINTSNGDIQLTTNDFNTDYFQLSGNKTIFIDSPDNTQFQFTWTSYNPSTLILSTNNDFLEVTSISDPVSTAPPSSSTLPQSGWLSGQRKIPYLQTLPNLDISNSSETISNNSYTWSCTTKNSHVETTNPVLLFPSSPSILSKITFDYNNSKVIKLSSLSPNTLNNNLSNTNFSYTNFLSNFNFYFYPSSIPNNHTLPVSISIKRPRRWNEKFNSFSADDQIKSFYNLQTIPYSLKPTTLNSKQINTWNDYDTTNLQPGDLLDTTSRIISIISTSSFNTIQLQNLPTTTTNDFTIYKKSSPPIEQSLLELTSTLTETTTLSNLSNIVISTDNILNLNLDLSDFDPINKYLFIYPGNGIARPPYDFNTNDNRGLYLITAYDNTTFDLTLEPIIGTSFLTYTNAYPDNYTFDLKPSLITDYPTIKIFNLSTEANIDLAISYLLLQERLLSYINNIKNIYINKPYVHINNWDDYVSSPYQYYNYVGPNDPTTISNEQFLEVIGNVNSPSWSPTTKRLSILDRRFYIKDHQLAEQYTNYPDTNSTISINEFLEELIESNDLRELRAKWIKLHLSV